MTRITSILVFLFSHLIEQYAVKMQEAVESLKGKLAEIGGHLQKLRWEAQDAGSQQLANDIAHAIDAIAWAAGIYSAGANVQDPQTEQNAPEIP